MENTIQKAVNALFDSQLSTEYILAIANALKEDKKFDLDVPKQAQKLSEILGLKFDHSATRTFESVGYTENQISKGGLAVLDLIDKDFSKNSQMIEFVLDGNYEYKNELITLILLRGIQQILQ